MPMILTPMVTDGEHFSASELACKHCGLVGIDPRLLMLLESLRTMIRRPLPIVSALRCVEHNHAVGGAARSQHLSGRAADLPSGLVTVEQARAAGARGVGRRGTWAVHVDMRVGPPATWSY